jgi:hypothetical protein
MHGYPNILVLLFLFSNKHLKSFVNALTIGEDRLALDIPIK